MIILMINITRETALEVQWTSAQRGPKRSVDIRTFESRIGLEKTKRGYPFGYPLLVFEIARRRTRSSGPWLCADRNGV